MNGGGVAWVRSAEDRRLLATTCSILGAALAFALLAYSRRWLADDGLIVVRTVRQLLEGNGPVYNAFERAEPNTSTLWTFVLAAVAFVTRQGVAPVAVYTGLVAAVLALVIGMDAARRFQRGRGVRAALVPASAFLVLGVYPFWDYATSGLENGLCLLWLAASWWLLVTLPRRVHAFAFVVGLGPLVRPDFGVVTIVFLIAGALIVRPRWPRALALGAVALALPLAYEIFRAGYYGTLVPLPALAKSASASDWGRGFAYLRDFVAPYKLFVPLGLLAGTLGVALVRRHVVGRDRIVVLAPVLSGALLALYVARVGGDFMHGRMWLSPLFVLALPALVVPATRAGALVILPLVAWGLWTGRTVHHRETRYARANALVNDERAGYVWFTGDSHPTDEATFRRALPDATARVADVLRDGAPRLVSESGVTIPLARTHDAPVALVMGRLGTGGAIAPLQGIVVDTLGLANPLGARITMTFPEEAPGHQKALPWAWVFADFVDSSPAAAAIARSYGATSVMIEAARNAMTCGELAELLASVRAPLTAARFWNNLTGAIARTRLVIPSDPIAAEWKFCGARARAPQLEVTSSYQADGWSIWHVIDGERTSVAGVTLGYSSESRADEHHTETLTLRFASPRPVHSVILHPRTDLLGEGFPVDFTIEVWDGVRWVPRVTRTGHPRPEGAVTLAWTPADATDRVRLVATRLRAIGDVHVLQLAELEVP